MSSTASTRGSKVLTLTELSGLPALRLAAGGGQALVYLYGAHVASFQTEEHGELLWMSPRAVYAPGKAIRGGIPVCFPWFGAHGTRSELPAHGFARTTSFTLEGTEERGDCVVAELALRSSPETLKVFSHEFVARLRVSVGRELRVAFEVQNTGTEPLEYELALHTYLTVGDVTQVALTGLAGERCYDKVTGARDVVDARGPLHLVGETDRVYASTGTVVIEDPLRRRRLVVDKSGSGSTVVWNPWIDKAGKMSDVGADAWRQMVCVEAGNISPHAVQLESNGRHTTSTTVRAEHIAGTD